MKKNEQNHIEKRAQKIAHLVAAHIRHTITKQEQDELQEWIAASDQNKILFQELSDERNVSKLFSWMDTIDKGKGLNRIHEQIEFTKSPPKKNFHLWQNTLKFFKRI